MGPDTRFIKNTLLDLVNINSVFPHETDALFYLEKMLEDLKIPFRRIPVSEGRWNILASLGEGSPVFCLCAHIDTMPINGESTPVARLDGDILHGLGSCDDKSSVTAMLSVLNAFKKDTKFLKGRLDLLISVDEEGDAEGVKTAVDQGYRCDYAIVGEPTTLDLLSVHCGLLFLELSTHGVSTHGSTPWNGINAINEMFELIAEIKGVISNRETHSILGRPSLNLGAISAGDVPHRVPEDCIALADIRLVPPFTASQMLEEVDNILSQPRWKNASRKVLKMGEPYEAIPDSKLLKSLSHWGTEILGHTPQITGRRFWTEADLLRNVAKADVIVCGPGDIKQAHSSKEFVSLSQVDAAANLYFKVVLELMHSC